LSLVFFLIFKNIEDIEYTFYLLVSSSFAIVLVHHLAWILHGFPKSSTLKIFLSNPHIVVSPFSSTF
jgi:hypothetical protein